MTSACLKTIVHACIAANLAAFALQASAQAWGTPPESPIGPVVFSPYEMAFPQGGIYLTPDEISVLSLGLTKDQLKARIGLPHFGGGIGDVTEWGYVVTVKQAGDIPSTCELQVSFYKTRFNDPYRISHMTWDKPDCSQARSVATGAPQALEKQPAASSPSENTVQLLDKTAAILQTEITPAQPVEVIPALVSDKAPEVEMETPSALQADVIPMPSANAPLPDPMEELDTPYGSVLMPMSNLETQPEPLVTSP